ncbi:MULTISPECIES: hypothetical protein [Lysinibacillus]|uniref:Uncharacterized protein n=3 Tax=Lysinibacillus TaxID=400634 RepID=B1HTC4_LYSSC|nr:MULTISPECIES: hypothetical protein [Lysinibacillus]MBE5083776.1 hypothetical protein [Bacillus thuringiensis]ACA39540.1 hypothetical protein Bsph_1951 [Lysinibacillus sphaericus C3-41]AMO34297.1 hypothetical protein AR327_18625 [Lysinibacillus sphaericus]AMR90591.1 hypothetical protein A1T07_10585 [Lysinibacillus sphaericus]ANA44641.1 hypothetical protein A2J09_03255 [Lysinibacillus sphaericus]
MNLFDAQTLTETLSGLVQPYMMNELTDTPSAVDGFVTNAMLTPDSTFHFHSLSEFKRGDYISINSRYYLVMTDVVAYRRFKYKALVQYCNYVLEPTITVKIKVGTDAMGRPIYKTETVVDRQEPAVISYKEMTVDEEQIVTATKTLVINVQDNTKNRKSFQVNETIKLYGRSYKVINAEIVKAGLIELKVQSEDVLLPI